MKICLEGISSLSTKFAEYKKKGKAEWELPENNKGKYIINSDNHGAGINLQRSVGSHPALGRRIIVPPHKQTEQCFFQSLSCFEKVLQFTAQIWVFI